MFVYEREQFGIWFKLSKSIKQGARGPKVVCPTGNSASFHKHICIHVRVSINGGTPKSQILRCGYGSIPINTIFSGMNIHKSQLFWCEQKGYYWFWHVLTHCHVHSPSFSLFINFHAFVVITATFSGHAWPHTPWSSSSCYGSVCCRMDVRQSGKSWNCSETRCGASMGVTGPEGNSKIHREFPMEI